MIEIKYDSWFVKHYLSNSYPKTFCGLVWYTLFFTIIWAMLASVYFIGLFSVVKFGLFPPFEKFSSFTSNPLLLAFLCLGNLAIFGLSTFAAFFAVLDRVIKWWNNKVEEARQKRLLELGLTKWDLLPEEKEEAGKKREPSKFKQLLSAAYQRTVKKACVLIRYT